MASIPNPWSGLRGLPRDVWALALTTLVNRMGTMALPFLVLYLTRSLHFTPGDAAFALASFGVGSLVSAPLAGKLCDRVGAYRVMVGALLASGVVMMAYPLVHGLPAIVALTVLWAVLGEAFRPANLTALADATRPEDRKRANALVRLAVNLGMSIGPAVGGLLATISFSALFVVDGATTLLAAGVLVAAYRGARARPAAAAPAPGAAPPRVPGGVLRDRRMLSFLMASSLVAAVFFQHVGAMPLYLVRDLHLTEAHYGMLFAVNTVLIVLFEVQVNTATAHWSHRRGLVVGSLLCTVGFGALAFATGLWSAAATVLVWTLGEMILFPGMSAYVADVAPPERRGEYMGAYQMSFGLAFAVAPWAGTTVLDRFGGQAVWAATAVCGVAATAVIARAVTSSRPEEEAAVQAAVA
jgi:predicted MFS family arabinose efflux permease